jgi:hypothetical protein
MSGERDLALSGQLVSDFQNGVMTTPGTSIYRLPDLSQHINHAGKYTRPAVTLRPGFFIDHGVLGLDEIGPNSMPDTLGFLTQPGNRLGREDSHHHVFFGKLQMENGSNLTEAQVAIKPFDANRRDALLGELAMFQYLNGLNIPTFQPAGVLALGPEKSDHLLTLFDGPVATMDTIDWYELDTDEKWLQLGYAIDTAVELQSKMLFHGDLEFKNVAFDETGQRRIVDPELMISARDIGETILSRPDDPERQRAMHRLKQLLSSEFTAICSSIRQFIFRNMPLDERPANEAAEFKEFNRHLFRPHREALEQIDSPYIPVLLEAFDTMVHEKKQQARDATRGA